MENKLENEINALSNCIDDLKNIRSTNTTDKDTRFYTYSILTLGRIKERKEIELKEDV